MYFDHYLIIIIIVMIITIIIITITITFIKLISYDSDIDAIPLQIFSCSWQTNQCYSQQDLQEHPDVMATTS